MNLDLLGEWDFRFQLPNLQFRLPGFPERIAVLLKPLPNSTLISFLLPTVRNVRAELSRGVRRLPGLYIIGADVHLQSLRNLVGRRLQRRQNSHMGFSDERDRENYIGTYTSCLFLRVSDENFRQS